MASALSAEWRCAVETQMKRYKLTPRKREVAWLLLTGMSTRDIADTMFISTRTVKNHVSEILWMMEYEYTAGTPTRACIILGLLGLDMDVLRADLKKGTLHASSESPSSVRRDYGSSQRARE